MPQMTKPECRAFEIMAQGVIGAVLGEPRHEEPSPYSCRWRLPYRARGHVALVLFLDSKIFGLSPHASWLACRFEWTGPIDRDAWPAAFTWPSGKANFYPQPFTPSQQRRELIAHLVMISAPGSVERDLFQTMAKEPA